MQDTTSSADQPVDHPPLLAVDLDGTLIRSDMLLENWWNVVSRDIPAAARALRALPEGKAAFKKALADTAKVDVSKLPYNDEVLARIQSHRDAGGRVALVTASDRQVAQQIADHLGIFDEVHGSDGETNLKADRKAAFLIERFGRGEYDYIGDHEADLEVWKGARKAITVNAPDDLRTGAEAAAAEGADHLGRAELAGPNKSWLRAVRPHQWAKNVLIFLPVLMAHSHDPRDWVAAMLAFIVFSMIASSVYLLNDLLDLSADRAHPRKSKRPLPSGEMALLHGSLLAPALLLGGLLLALLLLPFDFFLVLLGYFILTTAYSLNLKRRLVIDICTLATLYTVRIIAGGAATGILISPWLLAFSGFLFLSLAAIKRQAELISDVAAGREGSAGRAYVTSDIPVVSGMALTAGYVSVLVLALYISTPSVSLIYERPKLLGAVCAILLYWISRVVMLTHRGKMHDDPVVFALKDSTSRICGVMILLIAAAASFG
ncbi:UbiA family prenyltransferase [Tropicimonas aquimaris]|uniref:UbiA family prenyltransferase n=1 Tax=Tropicimonas aquimaris TaxID=914152 RepID=A0ABW3IWD2_9RHOB